jgi:hypothetical protein
LTDVDLAITKIHIMTDEIFFSERGGVDTNTGGMGFGGFHLTLPLDVINIGKTWLSTGYWSDRSYRYKASFSENEDIRICYNATTPIILKLTGPSKLKTYFDGSSLDTVFTVPKAGSYEFNLDANQTALVSFRCYRLTGKNYIGNASTPLELFSSARYPREPTWIPVYTLQTITGSLGITSFPAKMTQRYTDTVIEDHDVLSIHTESGVLILYTGLDPDCILYPEGTLNTNMGYTMIQDLSLMDLVNAYRYNLTVTVAGFPFQLARNGSIYQMFLINGVTLSNRAQLILVACHTFELVSGRSSWSWGERLFEQFPLEFNTGYTTYDDVYGNQVHNFQIYLLKGDRISYQINASSQIDFRFYSGVGYRGFRSDPENYLYMENKVVEIDQKYTATRTGAYNFVVRGYSGASGTVVFDCSRVP